MTFTIALMMILMYGLSVNMRNTAVHLILQMIWLSSSMMHITAAEILSVNAIMVRAGVHAVQLRLQNIFTNRESGYLQISPDVRTSLFITRLSMHLMIFLITTKYPIKGEDKK